MKFTTPEYYFDLTAFKHRSLFEVSAPVWNALSRISPYLKSLSLGRIETDVPQGVYLIHPELISIGKGTVLEPGAYIKGPCWIGEHCTVRHGAYLRGDVITGDHCVLGHASEFKNAILLDGAHAAHFAYVGDSILGSRVNLGAGTVCANLKLDKGLVTVHAEGERVGTGLKKFGAILGDDAQTGCHAVLNPGTLFGKNALCYPCMNVGGFVPANQVLRSMA